MENQDSTSNDPLNFPDQQQYLETIGKAADSQPTKTKVTAFKSRVFKLIKIYTQKSPNLNPLLNNLSQQIFVSEPERMNELILQIIQKHPNLQKNYLNKIIEIYKIMLLYKSKPEVSSKLSETFVKLLKKVINQQGNKVIQQMVQMVFTKRNCKINQTFFQFITRKIPALKSVITSSCDKLLQKNMRPAQKKQLQKMKNKLRQKVGAIKKQEIEQF